MKVHPRTSYFCTMTAGLVVYFHLVYLFSRRQERQNILKNTHKKMISSLINFISCD